VELGQVTELICSPKKFSSRLHFSSAPPYVEDLMANENGFGVVILLEDLEAKLRIISGGLRKWTVELAPLELGEDLLATIYARIWYTDRGQADMPNELCYGFPIFKDCFWRNTFVCIHPGLAVPVQMGLYLEGDRLLWDPLEDFDRFWPPIRKVLS
jgi:hypothetical protein